MGQDLYLYTLVNGSIFSLRKQKYIPPAEDDRGLSDRLQNIFDKDTKLILMGQGLVGITFCCAEYSGRFKDAITVNKVLIYDGLTEDGFMDESIFRAKIFTYLKFFSSRLVSGEFVHRLETTELYHPESVLYAGSGDYYGLVARKCIDGEFGYLFEDAFGNMSEPKYVADIELTELSPSLNRIEDLIEQALATVNWDLVQTSFPHKESGKYKWITSLMFDQFYFDILYYSIAKRVFLGEQNNTLEAIQGTAEEPVLVDFASVRRMLYQAIKKKMGSQDLLQLPEDTTLNEEEDVSWIFDGGSK